VNLSAEDDERRQRADKKGLAKDHEEFSHIGSIKTPYRSRSVDLTTDSDMKISYIESTPNSSVTNQQTVTNHNRPSISQMPFEESESGGVHFQKKTPPRNMQSRVKAIDIATWRESKTLVISGYPRRSRSQFQS